MSELFAGLMKRATELTRSGRLAEATQAIQQALSRDAARSSGGDVPTAGAAHEALVIDVDSRVVDEPAPVPSPVAEFPQRWDRRSFQHQGQRIDYMLFVPAGKPSKPRPLVLMLHGCTQDAEDFARGTRMNDHAQQHEAIVIYPEQPLRAHGQKCWNWFKPQHQARGRGEPALLCALTAHVAKDEDADASRLYVAGLSAGGAMAAILGRCYPDVFAAIGVHSGLPHGAASDLMSALGAMKGSSAASVPGPACCVPTIVFHGDADSTVHPSNGRAFVDGRPDGERREGQAADGRRFTRTVYPRAGQLGDAEHWVLRGGAHAWSGGSPKGSYTAAGVDASEEFMRFFLAHTLDQSRA